MRNIKSLSTQFLIVCLFACGCSNEKKPSQLSTESQRGTLFADSSDLNNELREETPRVVAVSDHNPAGRSEGNWPQWRGPARTDISAETDLLRQWPEGGGGPKQLWVSRDAGIGYSGPAIVDGVLYTMGALPLSASGLEEQGGEEAVAEAKECVIAMDAATGELLWSSEVGNVFQNNWGNGPRCTPTIDGDFVYALSALGDLVCLEKENGKQIRAVHA